MVLLILISMTNKKKNILTILSKIIDYYFNKNIFDYVYKKLSKYFRKNNNSIQKFEKIYEIWKLLYDIENISLYNIKTSSNITFFNKKHTKSNNLEIIYKEKTKYKKNEFEIFLNFDNSPIHNLNKFNNDFYFLKLESKENHGEYIIKYKDIFNENNPYSFSDISSIIICLEKSLITILINERTIEIKTEFDFDSVTNIKILDYFYGQIRTVLVIKKDLSNNKNIALEIKKDIDDKVVCDIKSLDKGKDLFEYKGTIFNSNKKYNNKWKRGSKELNEIEYFGGFNCFIPLFKIIKYLISNLEKEDYIKKEVKDIKEYINNKLKYTKDILKIMIKLICYSENNYNNLKKIIVSLICSLAEINDSLNVLINKNLINENIKSFLFQDEIIYSLFSVIIMFELPFNIINAYINLFEINKNKNWDINNYKLDYFLIKLEKNNIINIEWYFSILFNFIIFTLLFLDSNEKIPKILREKLNQIFEYFIKKIKKNESEFFMGISHILNIINNLNKNDDNDNDIINDFFIENDTVFKNFINLIKIYLNLKFLMEENIINSHQKYFMKKINSKLINENKKKCGFINYTIKIGEIKKAFKNYIREFKFLKKLFPFLIISNFENEGKLLINELIDYHGIYHHLMKELFIFNRLWSKKKLFYNSLDSKQTNLKYKSLNYYTNNFQRPIIYPVLDYKNRYPKFSIFNSQISYYVSESKDYYNFDFNCSNYDEIIKEYDKKIFEKMAKNTNIIIYKVCLLKQMYHVKGNLFILKKENNFIICFYSHSYDFKTKSEIKTLCNKSQNNNENNLCYGSIFECHEKEKNRKITISIKDIRMILKRIFYYRLSGIEIFTTTKSYYFNFYSKDDLNNFFLQLNWFIEETKLKSFFPIKVKNNIFDYLGYIKINTEYASENVLKKINNNFIDFIDYISKEKPYNICVFDIIILINLISNRSYIDLNQYPVFPMLFFYEKTCLKNRKFEEHIGFQDCSEKAKFRKELFIESYNNLINERNTKEKNIFDEQKVHYFNVHYSNIVYISNYMIRLFPFSFLAIELQGDGFDNPNRLFSSIEETFNNIITQKSDLRELIPEFFYLPEMFINLNFFYFKDKKNEELVDTVKIPMNISSNDQDNNIKEINQYYKDGLNIINNHKNINKDEEYEIFLFIDYMKKKLEGLNGNNLSAWLKIIFGEGQKYKGKNKELLFREESYIDPNEVNFENYSKNELIMKSVEFGLIPLQTIYDSKFLNNFGNNYEKLEGKRKESYTKKNKKNQQNETNNNIENQKINNGENKGDKYTGLKIKDNDIFNEINIEFKIDNEEKIGKMELYINNVLKNEIFDHNDKIIDIFYNSRLNMFATTSYDSYALIYILPNKLFSIIKHPNNLYFDKIFLSSNPFPTIITYEKQNNKFISYSLSGIIIKERKIKSKINKIDPIFNVHGGAKIDRIKIYNNELSECTLFNLPFFEHYNNEENK